MPRYKAIIRSIDARQAQIVLEDGTSFAIPVSILPKGAGAGTFLSLAVSVDRIAAFLNGPAKQKLIPREAKP